MDLRIWKVNHSLHKLTWFEYKEDEGNWLPWLPKEKFKQEPRFFRKFGNNCQGMVDNPFTFCSNRKDAYDEGAQRSHFSKCSVHCNYRKIFPPGMTLICWKQIFITLLWHDYYTSQIQRLNKHLCKLYVKHGELANASLIVLHKSLKPRWTYKFKRIDFKYHWIWQDYRVSDYLLPTLILPIN